MEHKGPKQIGRPLIFKLVSSLVILLVTLNGLSLTASAQGFNWIFGSQLAEEKQLTDEDIALITEIYEAIQLNYIEEVDKEVLLEGALKGMVDALGDPNSEYLNSQETFDLDDSLTGSFEGIGVQFMQLDGEVTVISPIADTPADKAGIQPNDVIIAADGVELTGMDTNEVVSLIRGPVDSEIELTIKRGTATFDVTLVRASIPLITVLSEVDEADPTVGLITITQFAGNTAEELVTEVESLRKEGVTHFVFDLRYNPGGLLDQALVLSNMFLEDGDMMMQVDERAVGEVFQYVADDKQFGDFQITEPYVVLVNEGSASASEILAAAIQENTDFPILGETSFGKGIVQNITNESSIGELKLTIAKWLTPSGEWINEVGIEPDQVIKAEAIRTAILLDVEDELRVGESSEFIESLSVMLDALDYEVTVGPSFDQTMEEAVKAFQTDHDLETDGIVTGDTAHALNEAAREYTEAHDFQYDEAKKVLLGLPE